LVWFLTYRQKVIVVAGVPFLFFLCGLVFLLVFFGLLCSFGLGEGLVLAVAQLLNQNDLLLLGNDQLALDNLQDETVLILKFAVVRMVDLEPVCLLVKRRVLSS